MACAANPNADEIIEHSQRALMKMRFMCKRTIWPTFDASKQAFEKSTKIEATHTENRQVQFPLRILTFRSIAYGGPPILHFGFNNRSD